MLGNTVPCTKFFVKRCQKYGEQVSQNRMSSLVKSHRELLLQVSFSLIENHNKLIPHTKVSSPTLQILSSSPILLSNLFCKTEFNLSISYICIFQKSDNVTASH